MPPDPETSKPEEVYRIPDRRFIIAVCSAKAKEKFEEWINEVLTQEGLNEANGVDEKTLK